MIIEKGDFLKIDLISWNHNVICNTVRKNSCLFKPYGYSEIEKLIFKVMNATLGNICDPLLFFVVTGQYSWFKGCLLSVYWMPRTVFSEIGKFRASTVSKFQPLEGMLFSLILFLRTCLKASYFLMWPLFCCWLGHFGFLFILSFGYN